MLIASYVVSFVFVLMALKCLTIDAPRFRVSREIMDSTTAVHTANALRAIAFALLAHLALRYGA